MRVNIFHIEDEKRAVPIMANVNLSSCYPDEPDMIQVAGESLKANGIFRDGGGASPRYELELIPETPCNLLAQALAENNLDSALAPIMFALGIQSGDVAAAVFSRTDSEMEWRGAGRTERRTMLKEWLKTELNYI